MQIFYPFHFFRGSQVERKGTALHIHKVLQLQIHFPLPFVSRGYVLVKVCWVVHQISYMIDAFRDAFRPRFGTNYTLRIKRSVPPAPPMKRLFSIFHRPKKRKTNWFANIAARMKSRELPRRNSSLNFIKRLTLYPDGMPYRWLSSPLPLNFSTRLIITLSWREGKTLPHQRHNTFELAFRQPNFRNH